MIFFPVNVHKVYIQATTPSYEVLESKQLNDNINVLQESLVKLSILSSTINIFLQRWDGLFLYETKLDELLNTHIEEVKLTFL